jgi:hypothetical protein
MAARTPEEKAREQIDAMLSTCGWIVQDFKNVDFSAGRGIALREVPLKTGPCDYLLLVDRKAVGVIEAKKQGTTLSTVADQSGRYASIAERATDKPGASPEEVAPEKYEATRQELVAEACDRFSRTLCDTLNDLKKETERFGISCGSSLENGCSRRVRSRRVQALVGPNLVKTHHQAPFLLQHWMSGRRLLACQHHHQRQPIPELL